MRLLIQFVVLCIAAQAEPEIESQHQYPKRSNDDAALLEWGSSAIIHNADGVVAKFGPSAVHPEFELGIEALIVTASPRQGCEPLTNARSVETQIVVMVRGGCSYGQKAKTALEAGAAALIVVNNDRRSPDRAFAMSSSGEDEAIGSISNFSLPCVMISYASGQQLREHSPKRMRVFGGGGRPFIESVADAQPVLYLVHNAISDEEITAAKAKLAPALTASSPGLETAHRHLGPVMRGHDLNQFYERIASIVGYPVEHLSELQLERRRVDSDGYTVRDDRKLSPFGPGRDDARAQPVMTIYIYLDDIATPENEGALLFPRARPGPISVRPQKGLAAVFYSALEDGSLDRSAAHGDGSLKEGDVLDVLKLRVYANPRPLARRLILPLASIPLGQAAASKKLCLKLGDTFLRFFASKADAAIDIALFALAVLLLLPIIIIAIVVAKKTEDARAPPRRKKTTASAAAAAADDASSSKPTPQSADKKKKKKN